jgi:hypothetical protein
MTVENPFAGTLKLALKLGLYGVRSIRQVQISFAYTPDWPFLDPAGGVIRTATPTTTCILLVRVNKAQRRLLGMDPSADHFECGDLMALLWTSARVREAVAYAINIYARKTDSDRRKAAGLPVEHEIELI